MILEASPSKEVMYVSAVRVHVLVLSSLTLTVPTSVEIVVPFALMIAPSIEPLNVETVCEVQCELRVVTDLDNTA